MTTTYDQKLHKIVPIEPTEEMLEAACLQCDGYNREYWRNVYLAMCVVSPEITLNQWQDISTAPADGQRVLISIEGANKAILAQKEKDGKWWTVGEVVNWEGKNVTHWMPLPTAPTPPEN